MFGRPREFVRVTVHNITYEMVHVLQLLRHTIEISDLHISLCPPDISVTAAARGGHLPVCKWAKTTFKLTAGDARDLNNKAFFVAAQHGRLHVCQWLVTEFSLTTIDVEKDSNRAFNAAGFRGHVHVTEWIVSRFWLVA